MNFNSLKLFAIALVFAALAPAASAGWWAGHVVDQNTTAPLSALVVFTNANTSTTFNTTSNSTNGFFNATGLTDGVYTITFFSSSYITKTYDYTNNSARVINNSNSSQAGYYFNPAFFNFTLQFNPAPGTLWGIVSNSGTNATIAGATITLSSGGTAATNGSGYYSFSLSPTTLNATASAVGFNPQAVTGIVIIANASTQQNFALVPISAPSPTPTPPPSTGGGGFGGGAGTAVGCAYANPVCGAGFDCDYRNNVCVPSQSNNNNTNATPAPSPTSQPGTAVEIRAPTSGTQGDFLTVIIVDAQSKQPVSGVSLQVKFPDNRIFQLPSDEHGQVRFVAEVAGIYKFNVPGRSTNQPVTSVYTRTGTTNNNTNASKTNNTNNSTNTGPTAGGFGGFFTAGNAPLIAGLVIAILLAIGTAAYLSRRKAPDEAAIQQDEKAAREARIEELEQQRNDLEARLAAEKKALRTKPKRQDEDAEE